MEIIDLGGAPRREVSAHDSVGLLVGRSVNGTAAQLVARLAPGGRIGRHEATGPRLFVPLEGSATVHGRHVARAVLIGPGQAAFWATGESHEITSESGCLALMLEGTLEVPAPSPKVSLRSAGPADADALAGLEESIGVASLSHVFAPERFPFPYAEIRGRWAAELADPERHTVVAESGDRFVGYASMARGRLDHLGVASAMQGGGLARLLLEDARSTYDGELRLWVLAENRRARAFYEREGWVPTGVTAPAEYPPHPVQVEYVDTIARLRR